MWRREKGGSDGNNKRRWIERGIDEEWRQKETHFLCEIRPVQMDEMSFCLSVFFWSLLPISLCLFSFSVAQQHYRISEHEFWCMESGKQSVYGWRRTRYLLQLLLRTAGNACTAVVSHISSMAVGMSVSPPLVQTGCNPDINGPQRMNPAHFGDPVTFPLAPPWGWYLWLVLICPILWFMTKYLQN